MTAAEGLETFIASNRALTLERTLSRSSGRSPAAPAVGDPAARPNGAAVFLDQLGDALRLDRAEGPTRAGDHEQLRLSAGEHGRALFANGLSLRQVVHDYGDICQTVTDLAVE